MYSTKLRLGLCCAALRASCMPAHPSSPILLPPSPRCWLAVSFAVVLQDCFIDVMASPSGNPAGGAGAPSAAQGMASGASSFIGALISLISRSDIRYQGFLATIDAEQATIALEKVRSWGTEGRMIQQGKAAGEELPPNENVYDYIVFRAADVKDLKIDDPHPQRNAPPPPPPQALQDPAIMGVSKGDV